MRLDAESLARLRLARTERVGPITFSQLVRRFGSAEVALEALPELAARGGGRPPATPTLEDILKEVEEVEAQGAYYVFQQTGDYPLLLSEAEGAPPILVAKGDIALARRTIVAIVGARNASASACRFARQIAMELGDQGMVIVSGLARGIDSAAHDGAMTSGTIGVVAGGIDIVFPPENQARQRAIGETGLLLSEHAPGLEPRARHFPRRNRIVAGIAHGTLVVEAAPKSGSLITARIAAEYGREVMAVPGSPLDPRAQGCNQLIREGATLVQNAADVIEALRPFEPMATREEGDDFLSGGGEAPGDGERDDIADLLSATPVEVDELVRQSGLPASTVAVVLLELELAGRLERHAGGRASLA